MNERLFRGKRVRDGEWVVGYYFCKANLHRILLPESSEESCYQPYLGYVVDPATIGQDTGLSDRNGKRIFEGDVFCGPGIADELLAEQVEFSPIHGFVPFDYLREDLGEVVGNVHDNPELLEPEEE